VSPFIGLCGSGQQEFVELAVQHGADINSSYEAKVGQGAGMKNFSPLQAAVAYNQPQVVAFLLSRGADQIASDYKGRTPLELAESKGHEEIARLLRKQLGSAE
jgi:ankyrin repeat protein